MGGAATLSPAGFLFRSASGVVVGSLGSAVVGSPGLLKAA